MIESTFDGRDTFQCEKCGAEVLDQWDGREEMELHEAECDGTDNPRRRFKKRDRVKYSDFGLKRLGRDQREGELVGWSRNDSHCVRVQWDGNKSATKLAHRFVKHVE